METMEELIKKMIRDLYKQVEEEVPEEGSFPVVYERYENPDKGIGLSHIILKVTAVPVKGHENKRYLELAAVNYPKPCGCEKVMGLGLKQDILKILSDEELCQKILAAIPKMEQDLRDM